MSYGAAAILMLFAASIAHAAGFDCRKAQGNVEKLICANERLSKLDEALNKQFRQALEKTDAQRPLVIEQRTWIQERNKCVDYKCLEKAYEARQASLKSSLPCPIRESDLLGHWTAEKEQDFEEMFFEVRDNERRFFSWRVHRPEMPGIWDFKNCAVHIRHIDDSQLSFEYAVVKHTGRVLHLRVLNGKETSTYLKTK